MWQALHAVRLPEDQRDADHQRSLSGQSGFLCAIAEFTSPTINHFPAGDDRSACKGNVRPPSTERRFRLIGEPRRPVAVKVVVQFEPYGRQVRRGVGLRLGGREPDGQNRLIRRPACAAK